MPKKPTTPFGYIAFSKDGAVTPHVQQLSSIKAEQENSVAYAFCEFAADLCGEESSIKTLSENDHDFKVMVGSKPKAVVQCTEIVFRDFLAEPSAQTGESIVVDGKVCPIDVEKRNDVVVSKIQNKLKKFYAKPEGTDLWLLIWSVTGCLDFYQHSASSILIIPESVRRARQFIQENGAGPFDRVLTFSLLFRPTQVWPIP